MALACLSCIDGNLVSQLIIIIVLKGGEKGMAFCTVCYHSIQMLWRLIAELNGVEDKGRVEL